MLKASTHYKFIRENYLHRNQSVASVDGCEQDSFLQ